jgi:hypothetical protein
VASEDETAPEDVALAYASPQQDVESKVESKPVTARAAPMGSQPSRAAYAVASFNPATATSVQPKSPAIQAAAPQPSRQEPLSSARPAPALTPVSTAGKVGDVFDDPWMRAVVVAPDLQNYMTVTSFDAPDLRQLRPMMEKPVVSVRMTFSSDPQLGTATDHFSGSAIVFLSTVNFMTRTASLQ